jgi:hypothetical protein
MRKQACIKARHSKQHRISEEEFRGLGDRVGECARSVGTICAERIAQLEQTARRAA